MYWILSCFLLGEFPCPKESLAFAMICLKSDDPFSPRDGGACVAAVTPINLPGWHATAVSVVAIRARSGRFRRAKGTARR